MRCFPRCLRGVWDVCPPDPGCSPPPLEFSAEPVTAPRPPRGDGPPRPASLVLAGRGHPALAPDSKAGALPLSPPPSLASTRGSSGQCGKQNGFEDSTSGGVSWTLPLHSRGSRVCKQGHAYSGFSENDFTRSFRTNIRQQLLF